MCPYPAIPDPQKPTKRVALDTLLLLPHLFLPAGKQAHRISATPSFPLHEQGTMDPDCFDCKLLRCFLQNLGTYLRELEFIFGEFVGFPILYEVFYFFTELVKL